MAKRHETIDDWIGRLLVESPPRSKSLIITLFGDLIAPQFSSIWLSELIALLAPFRLSEGLIRTSSFRLIEEGWLESQRDGRRSRYALTAAGRQRVEHAYRRVYDPPVRDWDGDWTLVISNKAGNGAPERQELRRELGWEGFGLLATGIFLHPCPDLRGLSQVLERLKLQNSVAVLQARDLGSLSACPMTALIAESWNLQLVAGQYEAFLDRFQPVLPHLHRDMNPEAAYVVQVLLIHSFRRTVLHDARLPSSLLPQGWPGHRAYDLCREIYSITFSPARAHLVSRMVQSNILAHPANEFMGRFSS